MSSIAYDCDKTFTTNVFLVEMKWVFTACASDRTFAAKAFSFQAAYSLWLDKIMRTKLSFFL